MLRHSSKLAHDKHSFLMSEVYHKGIGIFVNFYTSFRIYAADKIFGVIQNNSTLLYSSIGADYKAIRARCITNIAK